MSKHYEIPRQELKAIFDRKVLELATGIGSAINFLPIKNQYVGTDISSELLKKL